MNYTLDTNACIAILNATPAPVRIRFKKVITSGDRVFVSSIVAFELWYGVSKSMREDFNTKRLRAFFAGPILMLPFEDADARVAGAVRARLEESGKPIGAYDLLIAGQALQRGLTLVTANVSEFSRIKGLAWQDWAKS
jgi:tRNA(fMet)-specific endonuclease VapC